MQKDFDTWMQFKKQIHNAGSQIFFRERDIWFTSLGQNIGCEQDGKNELFERPVLILVKFNHTVFYGLPLTTRSKKGKFYFEIIQNSKSSSVILSQMRLFDGKRLTRKIDRLDESQFFAIKSAMANLIKNGTLASKGASGSV
jgi:mRNA-degrading endonuclease toxin of MazEF toxin-antitoxin module